VADAHRPGAVLSLEEVQAPGPVEETSALLISDSRNNELEQFFGSYRYHERRASGRKVACPGTVVRGSVRITAATASRLRAIEPRDLIPSDLAAWRALRESLERRQAVRALGRRFRRDPTGYLQELEQNLIKRALPP
jgi:hypothetical protein